MANYFDQYDEAPEGAVAVAEPPVSAPPSESKNHFDQYDNDAPVKTSTLGAAARSAATAIIPAMGAFAGMKAGEFVGVPAGAAIGALVPGAGETGTSEVAGAGIGRFAGGLIGSLVGSVLADKLQRKALEKLDPDTFKTLQEYQQADLEQHPIASFAGNIAGAATMFKVAPLEALKGTAALYKIARGQAVTKLEEDAAKALAVQAGMGAGLGVVNPLLEGQAPTKQGITESIAQFLILGHPRIGRKPPVNPLTQFNRESQLDIADAVKQAQGERVPPYQFVEPSTTGEFNAEQIRQTQEQAVAQAGDLRPSGAGGVNRPEEIRQEEIPIPSVEGTQPNAVAPIGGKPNAIPIIETGTVLQREQGAAGATGGERGRVEQGVQGNEVAPESEIEKAKADATAKVVQNILAAPRGDPGISHEVINSLSDEAAAKLFTAKNENGSSAYSPQVGSVIWGATQPAEIVPELIKLRDASQAKFLKAIESKNPTAQLAEQGKNLWYSGAIEGANRKGPNYDALVAAGEIKPADLTPKPPEANVPPAVGETQTVRTSGSEAPPANAPGKAGLLTVAAGEIPARPIASPEFKPYTILDAVKEHGPLGGPDLDQAMREMSADKTAEQIANRAGWDTLADIFETAYQAYRVRKNGATYNRIKRAYKAAGLGTGKRGAPDTAHQGMLDAAQNEGLAPVGGVPASPQDLITAAWEAAQAKVSGVKAEKITKAQELETTAEQVATDARFERDIARNTKGTEENPIDDLKVGSQFTLKGAKFRVESIQLDEAGENVISVTLDDGKRYGTQTVSGKKMLTMRRDIGSLKNGASTEFAPEEKISPAEKPAEPKTAVVEAVTPPTANLQEAGKSLFIPLNTKFYEAFKSGEKTEEYRLAGGVWNEKNVYVGKPVVLSKGYGKGDRLTGKVTGVRFVENPSELPGWNEVYGSKPGRAMAIKIELDKPVEASVEARPQKYQIPKSGSPQTWTLVEKLKATPVEIENGEQPVKIKNDKTGEVQTFLESELKPVKTRTAEEKAATARKSIDEQLTERGVNVKNISTLTREEKVALLERMKGGKKFAAGEQQGITVDEATRAVHEALGVTELPHGINVVHLPEARWGAVIDDRNRITVNAAQIGDPSRVHAVILEEGLHGVWSDPSVQRAWRDIKRQVSMVDVADQRIKREKLGLDTSPEAMREEAAVAALVKRQTNRNLVTKLLDAIKAALKKHFGIDLGTTSRQQLVDAATAFLKGQRDSLPGKRLVADNAIITAPGISPAYAVTAYHGTPHKVDKFTTAKIGTGEGAQVYGWGLYMAENPAVARDYASKLSNRGEYRVDGKPVASLPAEPNREALSLIVQYGWEGAKSENTKRVSRVYGMIESGREAADTLRYYTDVGRELDKLKGKKVEPPTGNEYTVELHAEPDDLLDWDKPVNKQGKVSEKLNNASLGVILRAVESGMYGRDFIQELRRDFGDPKTVSTVLHTLGLKGIRYLDQGSRQAARTRVEARDGGFVALWGFDGRPINEKVYATREEAQKVANDSELPQTYNYVIFNDADIHITHENGNRVDTADAVNHPAASRYAAGEFDFGEPAKKDEPAKPVDEAKVASQKRAAKELFELQRQPERSQADEKRIVELEKQLGQLDLLAPKGEAGALSETDALKQAEAAQVRAGANRRLQGADITTQQELGEKPKGQQSLFAVGEFPPGEEAPPADRPDRRGFGQYEGVRNVGQEGNIENLERIRRNNRAVVFDGTAELTPDNIQQFWNLAGRLTSPQERARLTADVAESSGGQSAPGLLIKDMRDFAFRMALNGDDSALRMMAGRSKDFALTSDVTTEAAARGLRSLRGFVDDESPVSAFKRLEEIAKQMREAAGERLGIGPEKMDQLMEALDNLNLSEREFMDMLRTGKTEDGRTLEQMIIEASPERQAAEAIISDFSTRYTNIPRTTVLQTVYEWMRREVVPADEAEFVRSLSERLQSLLGSSKTDPAVAQMIAEAAWNRKITVDGARRRRLWDAEYRKIDNMAEKEANSLLTKFESSNTEWANMVPQQVNKVREIVREALKIEKPDPSDPNRFEKTMGEQTTFTRPLIPKLIDAGVPEDLAGRLATAVYNRRLDSWSVARQRVMARAAESTNVRSLIEALRISPQLAQQSPEWLNKTAVDWFKSNGLAPDQAEVAAKLFTEQFNSALVKAREKLAERLVGRGDMKKLNDLLSAIRLGLTNPDQTWSEALAMREGWKPLSKEQSLKLAQLELQANDPAMSPPEIASVHQQMMSIERNAGLKKPQFLQAMAERYVSGLLSSIRTLTIQFGPTIMTLRDLGIMAASDPKNALNFATAVWKAQRNVLVQEGKYAWQKEAFGFHLGDMDLAHGELTRIWEKAEEKYKTGTPVEKAQARFSQLFAVGKFVTRTLNAIDQAQMATAREWKLAYYSSIAFKEAGISTSEIGSLIDAMTLARQTAFETALAAGLPPDTAKVRANNDVVSAVRDFVANKTDDSTSDRVLAAAEHDMYLTTGRKPEGMVESDEGMLSRLGPNKLMEVLSQIKGEGGWSQIMGTTLFGFVNIPYRTLRYFSQFGFYGLLRSGVDAYRTRKGKDTLWKQSFSNTLQSRARFREALAGSILTTVAAAWAANNNTTDEDAGKEDFGLYITGNGPQSKVLRDAWTKKGWKPYALNFVVGGHIIAIPVTRVGEALMPPFIIPASLDDSAWKIKAKEINGDTVPNKPSIYVSTMIGEHFYMSGQAGILQTATQLGRAMEGGQGFLKPAAKLAGSTVSASVLPLKQMLQSLSDMFVGPMDASSASAIVANQFPIVGLPFQNKAVNRFGDELYDRSWFGKMYQTGIPIAFQVSKTPENEEIYPMLVSKGVAPPELRRYVLEEKYGPVSNETFAKYSQISGDALKKSVDDSLPSLKSMTPEALQGFLQNAAKDADAKAAQTLLLERQRVLRSASGASGGVSTPSGGQSFNGGAAGLPAMRTGTPSAPSGGVRRASLSGAPKIRVKRLSTRRVSYGSRRSRLRLPKFAKVSKPRQLRSRRMRFPKLLA